MNARHWSRGLVIVGLAAMVLGAIDPLEGCVVILAGTVLAAIGALLSQTSHRRLAYWALGLVVFGVAAMLVLSHFGGIGGRSGNSQWWAIFLLPYPVGWILGLVGTFLALIELYRLQAAPNEGLQ